MEDNPYSPPVTKDPNDSSALRIREYYEKQELAIRLTGCWFLLFGLQTLYRIFASDTEFHNVAIQTRWIIFTSIGVALLIVIVAIGYGLLTLRRPARLGAILSCLVMFFGFPYWTIVSLYFLYTLLGAKSAFTLSPLYREAIIKTPDYRLRFKKSHWPVYLPNILMISYLVYFFPQ